VKPCPRHRLILFALVLLSSSGYAFLDLQLENKGPYFLPPEGRFKDYKLNPADTLVPLLSWSRLPVTEYGIADFENGWVVFREYIYGTDEIYERRVIYIKDLRYDKLAWGRQFLTNLARESSKRRSLSFEIPFEFPRALQRVFGEGGAGLHVSGYQRVEFSGRSEWTEGEVQTAYTKRSTFPSLQMKQESAFSITGTIGSKISVKVDQDTKRQTDLKNTINLRHVGDEDDILHLLEAGNTTISLPNTRFVGYSEHVQGLFGIKSELQIGPWNITVIASQDKGAKETAHITAGASQDKFTIRDYEYLQRTYFYIDSVWAFHTYREGDSITYVELYIDDQIESNNLALGARDAWAVPHPNWNPPDTMSIEADRGFYHPLDVTRYYINRKEGWIRLENPIPENYTLAVRYVVRHSDGSYDTVGGWWNGLPVYKIIKPQTQTPDMQTWRYEWRNVYSLRSRDIDPDGLDIQIFLGPPENGVNVDATTGKQYIQLFGLDRMGLLPGGGVSNLPDGKIDPLQVDYGLGELFFPTPHPFAPQGEDIAQLPDLQHLQYQVPAIYNSTDQTLILSQSRYYIQVTVRSRRETISLNRLNIIEGSESVYLNGQKLERGKDYEIDYMLGEITFLTDAALDPNADVKIDFQYEPFFQAEQKTLLGSRAVYNLWENSWIGATGLYKSESSFDKRPRVGEEPSRTFIWDSDLALRWDLPILTAAVDALPLVTTDSDSKIDFTAELAQVLSNPNTKNEAYLDDFEGIKDLFNLEVRRTAWTLSSAPYGREQHKRARLYWYNPYDQINTRDIWPNRETVSENSKTNVLALTIKDTANVGSEAWAGIMRVVPAGYRDQRKSKYLEIWVHGDVGYLCVDLGQISEDINGDGELQSEDIPRNGFRDGVLQNDEDTGLDGLWDEQEPGFNSSTNIDPHGDDWNYSDHYDYSHINGTEGNGTGRHLVGGNSDADPDGGRTPDTEDINHNGHLDTYQNYYEYQIDLSTNNFEVPGTRSPAGWRLLRIPIKDSLYTFVPHGRVFPRIQVGTPNWERIEFARIWVTGLPAGVDSTTIMIASIELVGNKWETNSSYLDVTVKSSQENIDYTPPPGIVEVRDPQTNLLLPEQSLVLKYTDLPVDSSAFAYRVLFQREDYTFYEGLRAYAYLSPNYVGSRPIVFFRLGTDVNNYYEYRVQLQPGWAPQHNTIEINLPEITAFKNELQMLVAESVSFNPDTVLKPAGEGYYRVKGNPSLSNITRWEVGIYNPDRIFPISGEVWIDELRLVNVRRNPGWAERADLSVNFADLSQVSTSIERRDWDFHDLTTPKGSGVTTTSGSGRVTFQFGKFFPIDWNIALPASYSYTKTISTPRLKVGSDIVLPDSLRKRERGINTNKTLNINFGMRMTQSPWWIAWTLNRMQHAYSWQDAYATSPTLPSSKTTNTTLNSTYDLSPGVEYDFAPLGFIGLKFLHLNILPTKLFFTNNITSTHSQTLNQYGNKTENKTKYLVHRIDFQTRPWKPFGMTNSVEWRRDIRRSDQIIFNFKQIKIGAPIEKKVTTQMDWSPGFLSSFLTQRYGYSSSYADNSDPERNIGYFGSCSRIQRWTANLTLNLRNLFGIRGGKSSNLIVSAWTGLITRFQPITGTYTHERQQQISGLKSRPGVGYQFGFTNAIGAETIPVRTVGMTQDGISTIDDINAQTGAKLMWDTDLTLSLQARREHKIGSSEYLKNSLIFPNLTVKWGGISRLGFVKRYTSSTTLSSAYSYRRESEYQQKIKTRVTKENAFNPAADLSINWKFGLRTQLTYKWSSSVTENMQTVNFVGISNMKQNGLSIQNSYSLRAPHGIKLPLIGKTIKFENNLNLGLQISRDEQQRLEYPKGGRPVPVQHTIKWAILPNASYDFSSNLRSGLSGEFSDTKDVIQNRTTKVRGLTIWAELRF